MFSTHTVGEAQRFADRVIVLADGEVLFDGAPAAFIRQSRASSDGRDHDLERALVAFLEQHGR